MSKVLHMLDWNDLLSYRHEKWIVEEMKEQEKFYKKCREDLGLENKVEDQDFSADDIPF